MQQNSEDLFTKAFKAIVGHSGWLQRRLSKAQTFLESYSWWEAKRKHISTLKGFLIQYPLVTKWCNSATLIVYIQICVNLDKHHLQYDCCTVSAVGHSFDLCSPQSTPSSCLLHTVFTTITWLLTWHLYQICAHIITTRKHSFILQVELLNGICNRAGNRLRCFASDRMRL